MQLPDIFVIWHQFLEGSKALQSFTISGKTPVGTGTLTMNLNFCRKPRNLGLIILTELESCYFTPKAWRRFPQQEASSLPHLQGRIRKQPSSTTPRSSAWAKAAEDSTVWHWPKSAPQHTPVAQQLGNSPGMQPFPTGLLRQLPDQRFLWNPLPLLLPRY